MRAGNFTSQLDVPGLWNDALYYCHVQNMAGTANTTFSECNVIAIPPGGFPLTIDFL